jgi:hypothetical protein
MGGGGAAATGAARVTRRRFFDDSVMRNFSCSSAATVATNAATSFANAAACLDVAPVGALASTPVAAVVIESRVVRFEPTPTVVSPALNMTRLASPGARTAPPTRLTMPRTVLKEPSMRWAASWRSCVCADM